MNAIEVEGLTKSFRGRGFRRIQALSALDLEVPAGCVFGFLGPNGSGKTTTIRCLLGLVRPETGRCAVLGRAVPANLEEVLTRVGAIVDRPSMFGGFSARRHLRLLAKMKGMPAGRVEEVLDRVGLAGRAEDRVRGYSLGMRQRLGLAVALLRDPELLVLDEPANGLDPEGVREVRELLRALADEGRTVFLSSHLLTEVEALCDQVAVVNRGRRVFQGTLEELTAGAGSGLVLRVSAPRKGMKILQDNRFGVEYRDGLLMVDADERQAARLSRILAQHEIYVKELRPQRASLEDLFLDLTSGEEP